jgi:hypothetical protein
MNDPILKRKLFSNKARHFEQIKTGNVPGHVIGGLGTVLNILGRVGPAARKVTKHSKLQERHPKDKWVL